MSYMITVREAAQEIGVSDAKMYSVFRKLNEELKAMNKVVIPGRLPRAFWEEKTYRGVDKHVSV